MRRLKILTWHTHGAYLHYLTRAPHEFYVLSKPGRPPGYGGRCGHIPWGENVHDLPVEQASKQPLDCIVFQDDAQYLSDQHELLTSAQRRLPKIYLEHDPPRQHVVDERRRLRPQSRDRRPTCARDPRCRGRQGAHGCRHVRHVRGMR